MYSSMLVGVARGVAIVGAFDRVLSAVAPAEQEQCRPVGRLDDTQGAESRASVAADCAFIERRRIGLYLDDGGIAEQTRNEAPCDRAAHGLRAIAYTTFASTAPMPEVAM